MVAVSSICQQPCKFSPRDNRCRHFQSRSADPSEQHRPCWWLRKQLRIANRKLQERHAELDALRRAKTEKYVPPWASEARLLHHQFSARIIAMCCCLAVVIGFRAVPKVLKIINRCLELDIPVPSRDAVRLWNCRNGVAILQEAKKSTGWIWMIDHSVQLGKMCVLVVLGIHKDNIPRNRPLRRSDMTVLAVSPAPSRSKEEVRKQLLAVAHEFGHPFATICDGASELREAVATLKNEEFSGLCLYDTRHRIAARLKIVPGKSDRWIEFEGKVGCAIAQLQQTELDHLMPSQPHPPKTSTSLNSTTRPLHSFVPIRVHSWFKTALNSKPGPRAKARQKPRPPKTATYLKSTTHSPCVHSCPFVSIRG